MFNCNCNYRVGDAMKIWTYKCLRCYHNIQSGRELNDLELAVAMRHRDGCQFYRLPNPFAVSTRYYEGKDYQKDLCNVHFLEHQFSFDNLKNIKPTRIKQILHNHGNISKRKAAEIYKAARARGLQLKKPSKLDHGSKSRGSRKPLARENDFLFPENGKGAA